jgi:DNA-binding response OmpR family regulator
LVEDDPTTSKALRAIFSRRGWEVIHASTIAAAMPILESDPDCAVLDLMLPDGDGSEILARIRAERRPIRVVVMTGSNDARRLNRILKLNPEVLLTKPIDVRALFEGLGLDY